MKQRSPIKAGHNSSSHTRSYKPQMPNGSEASILYHPSVAGRSDLDHKPSWFMRVALASGVAMVQTSSPKGWGWNPSVITLCLVILGIVASGAYYLGARDADAKRLEEQLREMQKQVASAQADAEKAKQLQTYNAGAVDATKGHVKPKENK